MEMFVYLKQGISCILVFVGIKMLLSNMVAIPIYVSLGVIIGILLLSVILSVSLGRKK
jgi:tellurite resistance protein TerC